MTRLRKHEAVLGSFVYIGLKPSQLPWEHHITLIAFRSGKQSAWHEFLTRGMDGRSEIVCECCDSITHLIGAVQPHTHTSPPAPLQNYAISFLKKILIRRHYTVHKRLTWNWLTHSWVRWGKKTNIQSDTVKWTFPIFQWKSISEWFSTVDISCNLWNRKSFGSNVRFCIKLKENKYIAYVKL